jgi:hypothetical protein
MHGIHGIKKIYTQLLYLLTSIFIINIPHDVWVVENMSIDSYTLDECSHRCITYSVTWRPEDVQARTKHVGATN